MNVSCMGHFLRRVTCGTVTGKTYSLLFTTLAIVLNKMEISKFNTFESGNDSNQMKNMK
jgi:hypothetical protein